MSLKFRLQMQGAGNRRSGSRRRTRDSSTRGRHDDRHASVATCHNCPATVHNRVLRRQQPAQALLTQRKSNHSSAARPHSRGEAHDAQAAGQDAVGGGAMLAAAGQVPGRETAGSARGIPSQGWLACNPRQAWCPWLAL